MEKKRPEICSCPKTECPRHGNCEECAEHHLTHEKDPHCQRDEADPKT